MKRLTLVVAGLAALAPADVIVSRCTILGQAGATPAERRAAVELRDHLSKIVGKELSLRVDASSASRNSIVVGQGPIARRLFPDVKWETLGDEQTLIRSKGDVLLIAGGRPRGTLYAAYRLLQEKCGVRWWAPWATTVPSNARLRFAAMNLSETPAFEYRDPFWFHSFDADWAARNFDNGASTRVGEAGGGKVQYEGFVHTYYGLVPPNQLFGTHPEWYSLIDGKRTYDNAQLCTTNPELRDFVVEQVRRRLRANPKAGIVSVSQNDCFRPCQCANCRALVAREGSEAALVLDLANYVGEKIESEFPKVAVDTLAYQWSRHPTTTMRPRSNVVVRLCSIECNFAYPLDAPQNAAFGDDIRGWSKLTNRLYVWDYCTNFANYVQPHPDYFTLGPTIKFFAANGVKGVFEEGAYQSNGADMAELKAWVIAQMLWDPRLDPNRLIDEFLSGYYGPKAAPFIRQYLELMANEAKAVHLSFALGTQSPFLRREVTGKADELWSRALAASPSEFRWRIEQSAQAVKYVMLSRWDEFPELRGASRKDAAEQWIRTITGAGSTPPAGWTPVTVVNEGSLTPQQFAQRLK